MIKTPLERNLSCTTLWSHIRYKPNAALVKEEMNHKQTTEPCPQMPANGENSGKEHGAGAKEDCQSFVHRVEGEIE